MTVSLFTRLMWQQIGIGVLLLIVIGIQFCITAVNRKIFRLHLQMIEILCKRIEILELVAGLSKPKEPPTAPGLPN